jgi:hypothetical protein
MTKTKTGIIVNLNSATNKVNIGLVIVSYHYKKGKNPRKIFTFNSRLQVFSTYKEATRFEIDVINKLNEVDNKNIHKVYFVSNRKAVPPPPDLNTKDQYYCPYCSEINYLDTNLVTNYKCCPICHCSIAEYEFKRYNDLWHKDSKQANTGKTLRKRRKRKDDKKS